MKSRVHLLTVLAGVTLAGALAPLRAVPPDPDFHLYLLIGQSNMAGRGPLDEESKKAHPRVVMLAKDLTWKPATDPLHFDKPAAGVGPGLAFGKRMAEANPSVRIGLIPCAVGGTSIKTWVSGAHDKATKTHPYDDMLMRVHEAQKTGVLKGILWHQGESDRTAGDDYGRQLTDLITQLRYWLNAPDVPFIAGEISAFDPKQVEATNKFNEVIRGLAGKVRNYGCVTVEGLDHKGDHLHYDGKSARLLGGRYAGKMMEIMAVPQRVKIGLGDGLSHEPRALPVQWIMVDRGTDIDGFFKVIGGVPSGIVDFIAFKAAPPYGLFLRRQEKNILLLTIHEGGVLTKLHDIPGKVLLDGDELSLASGELGIERAKKMREEGKSGGK